MSAVELVQVRLLDDGRVVYRDAQAHQLAGGDYCLVETSSGATLAEYLGGRISVPTDDGRTRKKPFLSIIRRADRHEADRREHDVTLETDARRLAIERIGVRKLAMKLVKVVMRRNPSKITFYFTAEGRVDFRELVKDLARELHTRIEMRQIGVRDEAKMVGGVGKCGHECCCSLWLPGFIPVSIRMAKDQNLSLIPTKISGQCGRLLCCLTYENQYYVTVRKELPRVGETVDTPRGPGRVLSLDFLKQQVLVAVEDGPELTFESEEVVSRGKKPPGPKRSKDTTAPET
jgi:cell fate regulator YaaT (PSP1 superfamily)